METEKEEQKLEQVEVEEQEEETTLVVRKSRNQNDTKTTEISALDFEVSNGVSESKGHAVQSELAKNGAENEDKTPAEVQEIEKLNGVLQNESEAIIGEQKSQNLVFYDNVEGVESEFTYFGERQILEDSGPQKPDTSSLNFVVQNNSTSAIYNRYEGEIENNTSHESCKEIESAVVDLINEDDLEVSEVDVERVIKKQTTHDLYCPNCNSCITKRVILHKRKRTVRVSEEELKRNRIETVVDYKSGIDSVQLPSNQNDNAQAPAASEDERERGPDVFRCLSCFSIFVPTGDGFKFRIFGERSGKDNIRNEQALSTKKNWFTLMFTSNKHETAVVEQGSRDAVIPSSNLSDQSGQPPFSQKTPTHTQEDGDDILPFSNQITPIIGKVDVSVGDKWDTEATETVDASKELFDYSTDPFDESKSSQVLNGNRETEQSVTILPTRTQVANGKSVDDAISFSQEDGLKLLISENKGYSTPNNSDVQISNQTVQPGAAEKEVIQLTPTSVPVVEASDVDGKLNISVHIPHAEQDVRATILTDSVLENKNANFSSSGSGHVHHTEVSQHMITRTEIEFHSSEPLKVDNVSAPKDAAIVQGKDTVLTIDQQPYESSQTMQVITPPTGTVSVSQSVTQSSVGEGERSEESEEFEIEVVKSIVYGGLAESVTSLSIVSSAAGGGAATLNVLALGAANLISGLFIIFHNLWDLKHDRVEQVSNQIVEQRDRYKKLLGRRQNFILHAVVAITSYIVFGLVPPIVYGFSFQKSDDKQLKLVVVGAASLLCILTLAIGKAYTQRPPKPYLKTVTTYIILGFVVSGVSYAAGELVERLLERLGVFQTSRVSTLVVPEVGPSGSGWASY